MTLATREKAALDLIKKGKLDHPWVIEYNENHKVKTEEPKAFKSITKFKGKK